MRTNIFSYTEANSTCYPEYISVNSEDNGLVSIVVRPKMGQYDFKCPEAAVIYLTKEQMTQFAKEIQKWQETQNASSEPQRGIGD